MKDQPIHSLSKGALIALMHSRKRLSEKSLFADAFLEDYFNAHQDKSRIPIDLRRLFQPTEEIFIGGGGSAGRSLPAALKEAIRYGLDLTKIKSVRASSVGTIMALAMALNMSPEEAREEMLERMPTDQFQDWSIKSIATFFKRWGWCAGKKMPEYFRELIKRKSGLDDPTFLQLFEYGCQHGFQKELGIITTNVSKKEMKIFSYRTTPNDKVAQIIGLGCSVPLIFPPLWMKDGDGNWEAFTDGGIMKNYPWRVGSDPHCSLEKQLGFIFVNETAAHGINHFSISNTITSFWRYLYNLISIAIFKDPLGLPKEAKSRTVAIPISQNPMNFTADFEQQKALDEAGRRGVRHLVRHIVKTPPPPSPSPSFLPSFQEHKHSPRFSSAPSIDEPRIFRKQSLGS